MTKFEFKQLKEAVDAIIDTVPKRKLPTIVSQINTLGLYLDELQTQVESTPDQPV